MIEERDVYRSFDAYVADFPEGEIHRRWLTQGTGVRLIFRGAGVHDGLTGGYLFAGVGSYKGQHWAYVNDGDDGHMRVEPLADEAAAQAVIEDIATLAPCSFAELHYVLGFRG